MIEDFEHCYRAVESRDTRFDGWFFTAVTSTGIYCRPSCPALTPKRRNVRFYPSAAAAQQSGFRACRRCRPDAAPGSPEWNNRADGVARAMRLIADGVVDRENVTGLARRLGYSERQLQRLLVDEVGAGPLALARAQRAHTARLLIETTDTPFAAVAFAAGFASVRQFNDTIRAVFATTPTAMRQRSAGAAVVAGPGSVSLRLAYRPPMADTALMRFFARRAVPGVEEVSDGVYRRTLRLPHGTGVTELSPGDGYINCRLHLDDARDLTAAVGRCRWLLDLDADPVAVDDVLARDPALRPIVRKNPGRRVAHTVDGTELVFRAILGQQVTLAAARTLAARLVQRFGKPLTAARGQLTHLFPDAAALAVADITDLGMPRRRAATIVRVAQAIEDGAVGLGPGADRRATVESLAALQGVGPWTVAYVAMRSLGDPDAFPATDLGLRAAATGLGLPPDTLTNGTDGWRPWRAYAAEYLWSTLEATP